MLNSPDQHEYSQVESLALETRKSISDEDYRTAIKNALKMFPNLRELQSADFSRSLYDASSRCEWIQELRKSAVTSLTILLVEDSYVHDSLDAFLNVAEELNNSPITELTLLSTGMNTSASAYGQFIKKCANLNKITLSVGLTWEAEVQDALTKSGFQMINNTKIFNLFGFEDYITFEKRKERIARKPYTDLEISFEH